MRVLLTRRLVLLLLLVAAAACFVPQLPRVCVVHLDQDGNGRVLEFDANTMQSGKMRAKTPPLTYGTVEVSSSPRASIWMTSHGFLMLPHTAPYDPVLVSGGNCFHPPDHIFVKALYNATDDAFYALVSHEEDQGVTVHRMSDQAHLTSCVVDPHPVLRLPQTRMFSSASQIVGSELLYSTELPVPGTKTFFSAFLTAHAHSSSVRMTALPHERFDVQSVLHDARHNRTLVVVGRFDDGDHTVATQLHSVSDTARAVPHVLLDSLPVKVGWLRFAVLDQQSSLVLLGFEDVYGTFSRATVMFLIDISGPETRIVHQASFEKRFYAGHFC